MDDNLVTMSGQYTHIDVVEDIHRPLVPIINDELYLFILFINMGVICQTITVFGTISNIINIIVFIKQRFTENVNISLLALAVADLTSLLFLMWSNLCFTPVFRDSNVPFVPHEVQLITGTWPHVIFTRITGLITAFISFERCMCVTRPLQVKIMFTRRRHIVTMISIFLVMLCCCSIGYVSVGLDRKFYPSRNLTLIGIVLRMDEQRRKLSDSFPYAISGMLMPITSFISVLICTTALVVKLNQQSSWRTSSSVVGKTTNQQTSRNKSVNTKDKKTTKMIVLICVIFIMCYLPAVGIFIAGYVEPQLSYDGAYRNMYIVLLSISLTTDSINSSVNIIIYLGMSTKYRTTLMTLLKVTKAKKLNVI